MCINQEWKFDRHEAPPLSRIWLGVKGLKTN